MAMEMQFEYFCSAHDPVPGLLVSLGIYVDMVNEGLDIILVLDGQEYILEVLSQGRIIVGLGDGSLA